MNKSPLTSIQAPSEADILIASTALHLSVKHPVVIVSEDTDLLALTLQHPSDEHEIFLTAPPKLNSKTTQKLLVDESFQKYADTFYKKAVSSEDVIIAREKLLLMIFGGAE